MTILSNLLQRFSNRVFYRRSFISPPVTAGIYDKENAESSKNVGSWNAKRLQIRKCLLYDYICCFMSTFFLLLKNHQTDPKNCSKDGELNTLEAFRSVLVADMWSSYLINLCDDKYRIEMMKKHFAEELYDIDVRESVKMVGKCTANCMTISGFVSICQSGSNWRTKDVRPISVLQKRTWKCISFYFF